MANVVIYDTGDNHVLSYLRSVNTPDYSERNDVVINPDLSAVIGIALKYWKHDNGSIVEMSQAEKDALDAAEQAAFELTVRTGSKAYMDNFNDFGLILRAMTSIMMKEINILRTEHSLANRTFSQLKTQIKSEVDSGDVD